MFGYIPFAVQRQHFVCYIRVYVYGKSYWHWYLCAYAFHLSLVFIPVFSVHLFHKYRIVWFCSVYVLCVCRWFIFFSCYPYQHYRIYGINPFYSSCSLSLFRIGFVCLCLSSSQQIHWERQRRELHAFKTFKTWSKEKTNRNRMNMLFLRCLRLSFLLQFPLFFCRSSHYTSLSFG